MIVSIHQPNFMPWLGFFHKLSQADVFILLDNVPFTKNGFQNRVKIKSSQGEQWLTVPVLTKGCFGQLTYDVLINNNIRWRKSHLATLRTNYQRAPYYKDIIALLEPLYNEVTTNLTTFNQVLLKAILHYLKLPTKLVLASSLASEGNGSKLLLQLVQAVGGDIYLSGPSGHDYLDVPIFHQAGVKVQFQQFQHPVYPQLYGDFLPGLSTIDLMMNAAPTEVLNCMQYNSASNQGLEKNLQHNLLWS